MIGNEPLIFRNAINDGQIRRIWRYVCCASGQCRINPPNGGGAFENASGQGCENRFSNPTRANKDANAVFV